MIDYRLAQAEDINSLKELWIETFDEKGTAVDNLFAVIFSMCNSFVATCDNKIVSMVHLINSQVNGVKALYLYAAATNKDFRSQGIMSSLIKFALNETDAEICVTLPASESLYSYYSKLGFEPLKAKSAVLSRKEVVTLAKPYELQEIFVNGFCGIRNRVLKDNFLFWNNKFIDYALSYNELYGAKIIKNNFGYAILFEDDNVCNVLEFICDNRNAPFLLTDILSVTHSEKFNFHLSPNQLFVNGIEKNYGMAMYMSEYKPDNIYLGLTLE